MTFKEKVNSMRSMLYTLIKPLLFSLDPETAHNLTLEIAKLGPVLGKLSGKSCDPRLKVKVGSVDWTFPIGLAAGLDKNAEALPFFSAQGTPRDKPEKPGHKSVRPPGSGTYR